MIRWFMSALNTDVIVYLTLAASFGMLLSAIKMHRTTLPQLGLKREIERDF